MNGLQLAKLLTKLNDEQMYFADENYKRISHALGESCYGNDAVVYFLAVDDNDEEVIYEEVALGLDFDFNEEFNWDLTNSALVKLYDNVRESAMAYIESHRIDVRPVVWKEKEKEYVERAVEEVTQNYEIYTLAQQGKMFESIFGSWYFRKLLDKWNDFHREPSPEEYSDYMERFYQTLRARILEVI